MSHAVDVCSSFRWRQWTVAVYDKREESVASFAPVGRWLICNAANIEQEAWLSPTERASVSAIIWLPARESRRGIIIIIIIIIITYYTVDNALVVIH